ncbi:MAG TPA: hypothetical protein PLP82_11230 [Deltaproteobacteria bacterium]|nr:hypothetical protein [Deltaproteobacteria bacterium]
MIFFLSLVFLLSSCSGSDGGDGTPGAGDYTVRYEVEGGSGLINEADVTYIDAPVPWTYSFKAPPDADLSLKAVLHGSGSTTLYATVTVNNSCWIDDRTFVAESHVSVSGTPEGIMASCPNQGGVTVY